MNKINIHCLSDFFTVSGQSQTLVIYEQLCLLDPTGFCGIHTSLDVTHAKSFSKYFQVFIPLKCLHFRCDHCLLESPYSGMTVYRYYLRKIISVDNYCCQHYSLLCRYNLLHDFFAMENIKSLYLNIKKLESVMKVSSVHQFFSS